VIQGKEKKPRRVPRTLLEQCRREYEVVVKERDEARETLRLAERNLAAKERAREPPPRPACTCGEPYLGCTFHEEACSVRAWMTENGIPPYEKDKENALGRVKANGIP
jgi:hypothetical protein